MGLLMVLGIQSLKHSWGLAHHHSYKLKNKGYKEIISSNVLKERQVYNTFSLLYKPVYHVKHTTLYIIYVHHLMHNYICNCLHLSDPVFVSSCIVYMYTFIYTDKVKTLNVFNHAQHHILRPEN